MKKPNDRIVWFKAGNLNDLVEMNTVGVVKGRNSTEWNMVVQAGGVLRLKHWSKVRTAQLQSSGVV